MIEYFYTIREMTLPDDIEQLKDLVSQILARLSVLEDENEALKTENIALKAENQKLKQENQELRRRLNQNSRNSHQPPSSDGLKKKPALPKKSGKKSGGQKGHLGKTLEMVDEPDLTVVHHAQKCVRCERAFGLEDVGKIISRRQVFDIPPPKLEVTEHQLGEIVCCQKKHLGEFPKGVGNVVQYGERIQALSVLLNNDYRIPLKKLENLFADLYGCSFNQSTAVVANERCYQKLEPIEEEIKRLIKASKVVNFDETGGRVANKLHWFHTACTDLYSYLFVHEKRGKEALMSEQSVIKDYENWAIHDCYASYFKFENCQHAVCNAHILRELESLKEQASKWAKKMKDLLMEMFQASEKGTKVLKNKKKWLAKYEKICKQADKEEPPPKPPPKGKRGRATNSVGRNLLNRLRKHQSGVLAFAFEKEVPFTNNQAERDLRCLKVKQKVSNSFRQKKGAENYARIQGFIGTVRKHQQNVYEQLTNVFEGVPFTFQTSK